MSEAVPDETRLQAEIARLKAEFPETRELYREVCALLFFRFGVAPTANRLYQLVRRGSMSTPVSVLAGFWAELREKSRVRIEHADLPEDLRDAAGELVATLWKRATGAAQDALQVLRIEVEAARLAAEASVTAVQADLARTETALEQRTTTLLTAQVRIQELEQAQAAAAATREALEGELARAQQAQRERDAALAQARTDFAVELDKQRTSTELAETRLQAAEKRALLEIERERSAVAKLQKEIDETTKRADRREAEHHRAVDALQAQLGDARHQAGVLQGRLDAMQATNEALQDQLATQREAAADTSRPARAKAATSRSTAARPAVGRPARKAPATSLPSSKTATYRKKRGQA